MDQRLLDILVCPLCRTGIRLEGDRLVCTDCGRRYPVRDGIPVMIVEEAEGPADGADRSESADGSGDGSAA